MAEAIVRVDPGLNMKYTCTADVVAGEVILQGELIGVVQTNASDGDVIYLGIEGQFECLKAVTSGSALTAGAIVYWDDTNSIVTTTVGSNKQFGKVRTAAADSATSVYVVKTI